MELNFQKLEEKILRFWKKNKIFERSIEKRKKDFVFYEGPPYANGRPGIHHFLARAFKDIVCRYKTMRGFRVLRKAGWDTHGLPTEMEVEKILGIKNKKEIEKLGIEKFVKECKKNVFLYKKEWEKFTERLGYWIDLKNAYITCSNEYIESVWFLLKKIWEKSLLYEDLKVSPYCPRCQTILSSHEVAQGYKRIKEPAIYVKFRVLNPEYKNCSLLVWTTTPWTLPGNVAIAVNPSFDYSFLEKEGEVLILAKERTKALNIEGKFLREVRGKDLIGLRYQPVFDFYQPDFEKERIWEVLGADFVSLEEGTGLVHIAPAFGEEDMELIKFQNSNSKSQKKFPVILNVDEEGKFKLEVKKFAGLFVKDADPLIIQDLKERGILFKEEIYEHDYPFCWRCKTPLLYYAKKSWFIKMTAVKKDLIKNNKKINWIPAHLKEGRFGEWLREVKDWALSRERYWGTPLPVWRCQKCKNLEVIGSINELISKKSSKNVYYVFRHGHSLRQVKNIASCWPEKEPLPLTKEGEEEVKRVALKLKKEKIDLIFSSDLMRAKQTAEILAKELNAKVFFDKRLREYNVGIFNGKPPGLSWQYIEKKKNPLFVKIPKGESLANVRKRMYSFLKDLEKKFEDKKILIVSHELPLTILEGTLKGLPLDEILNKRKNGEFKTLKTAEWRKIEFKSLPLNEKGEIDLHRPFIDQVYFFCPVCQGEMRRVPEVIDCWFDSGAMPFAQGHWPFAQTQNSKLKSQKLNPPKLFPADYIAEGVDQTRGWFYTLLAISTLMGFGPSYKNVISLGHVLDEKGEKMSKSKGNVVDPWYIIGKYGVEATRWYFFTINQPGDPKLFSEKDVAEALKKFILTFWNCYLFFETYGKKKEKESFKSKNILDRWIISRLENLIKRVTKNFENYEIVEAAREIENFVIEDLSLWYIRRSRRRFQRPKDEREIKEASQTLKFVLLNLSKILAPFLPFLSEFVYQKLQTSYFKRRTSNFKHLLSVHLENWPRVNKKLIDKKLERKMEKVREIVSLALAERQRVKIKVRQPLNELQITNYKLKKEPELLELIKDEVNVKKITFGKEFKLDTKITPELKEEGIIREIIRHIQEMRKEAGLKPRDKILVGYSGDGEILRILEKNKENVLKETKIVDLKRKEGKFDFEKEIKVDEEKLILAIKKIYGEKHSTTKRIKA
jgi:isoleucyl-tRNA synthetase